MTTKEKKEIASMTAMLVYEQMKRDSDTLLPLSRVVEMYGWSESYVYKNQSRLGVMKAGGKLFFSQRNIDTLIRNRML